MAKTKSRKPQGKSKKESGNEIFEDPEAIVDRFSKTEEYIQRNKTLVFAIGGIIALAVASFVIYQFIMTERNAEAQQEMFQAVYYFENNELDEALNGDGNFLGFLDIVNDYKGTKAANLAQYYIGSIYMKEAEFDKAIDHLNKFSSSDIVFQAKAYSLLGDAYIENGNRRKAAEMYEKAASTFPNRFLTPEYLEKAALVHELNEDFTKAAAAWEKIMNEYATDFNSSKYQNARRNASRLKALADKK
ncbi:MAG: tetratricopeptide repeat protein [Cyclobacteriaceae bacterium]|nr:tetratricopeptide repeat protein [Cyclobacteriaceae bacterium]MCH8517269.1 tetratricopeptide repeat protein [Cyclobacteriaceae bacterium]